MRAHPWIQPTLRALPLPFLLAACASPGPPPPAPLDAESGALAVSLAMCETLGPLRKDTYRPGVVLFVRLEDGQDPSREKRLIASNFVCGAYAYLLNAGPGTYAAVAALYSEDTEPVDVPMGKANIGSSTTVYFSFELDDGQILHRNYFSRAMIEKSRTTLAAGQFAFMGSYSADQSFRFGEADDLQLHFLHALEGEDVDRSGLLEDLTTQGRAHRLTLRGARTDRAATLAFCEAAREALADTAWVAMIDRLAAAP